MKIILSIISSLLFASSRLIGIDAVVGGPSPSYANTDKPTPSPTASPTKCNLECDTDDDCPRICSKVSYLQQGTCVEPNQSTPLPVMFPTTQAPTPTKCPCKVPKQIPDRCEVDILIDMMEINVLGDPKLGSQWTRAAFHDAGTFDGNVPAEGGANGCLLNHPPMRLQQENQHLHNPLVTLEAIKISWHAHHKTCIKVSSADILQFAVFFATTRQKHTPESLFSAAPTAIAKRDTLKNDFQWGRPDEPNCNITWTDNLPGFATPANSACAGAIPCRCTAAGNEIQEKMIDRNGFTAEEANALIGAHTIGSLRNTFGAPRPWVHNGVDDFTPFGPVFDNAYHDFLRNTIIEDTAGTFASNQSPFLMDLGNWFQTGPFSLNPLDPPPLAHLDTDVTLAFPNLASSHPDYSLDTINFAGDNDLFLTTFFKALHKMGTLGVNVKLFIATDCKDPCGEKTEPSPVGVNVFIEVITKLGNATALADQIIAHIQANRSDEIDFLTTPAKDKFTSKPTPTPTTAKPVTAKPTSPPTTTAKPVTAKPTSPPTTTSKPVTAKPTSPPTTTARPVTAKPFSPPTTTAEPVTTRPALSPVTAMPTSKPMTSANSVTAKPGTATAITGPAPSPILT